MQFNSYSYLLLLLVSRPVVLEFAGTIPPWLRAHFECTVLRDMERLFPDHTRDYVCHCVLVQQQDSEGRIRRTSARCGRGSELS